MPKPLLVDVSCIPAFMWYWLEEAVVVLMLRGPWGLAEDGAVWEDGGLGECWWDVKRCPV
jgi:hypothetical protein